MRLPSEVSYIIDKICDYGYRADVVGGCVRDFLLGREPNDYDITTSATPEEIKGIFYNHEIIETGIKHGTVTLLIEGEPYEITSYRIDGTYSDNRHPDFVSFSRRVEDDLSRRDFTVNAMCFNPRDGLTDLFGGQNDLENKIIRTVGDPDKRFGEDALRILRALRFAATLGFSIEENTSAAIHTNRHLLSEVSRERIYTEWKKLISGRYAYDIINAFPDVVELIIPEMGKCVLPEKRRFMVSAPEIRELGFFVLSGENCVSRYDAAMRSLRSDNAHREYGVRVLEMLEWEAKTNTDLIKILVSSNRSVTEGVIALRIMLGLSPLSLHDVFSNLFVNGFCYTLSNMSLNGNDLREVGIEGVKIGVILKELLMRVALGEVANEKNALLSMAKMLCEE